jgi:conjugal transfer pilus assembly protein TraA
MNLKNLVKKAALPAIVAGTTLPALAGTGGTEFNTVYDQISGWTEGTLGKTITVSALLVGLGVGVIKQSVIAAVVGLAMAMVAAFGPGVIEGVFTAAMPITQSI